MATEQVGTWRRWQDWAALVIGVLVALSPVVVSTSAATACGGSSCFGVLLALTGALVAGPCRARWPASTCTRARCAAVHLARGCWATARSPGRPGRPGSAACCGRRGRRRPAGGERRAPGARRAALNRHATESLAEPTTARPRPVGRGRAARQDVVVVRGTDERVRATGSWPPRRSCSPTTASRHADLADRGAGRRAEGLVHYYFNRKADLLEALVERLPPGLCPAQWWAR